MTPQKGLMPSKNLFFNLLLLLFAFKFSLVSCSVDNVAQEEMLGIWLEGRVDNQPYKRQKSVFKKEPFALQ